MNTCCWNTTDVVVGKAHQDALDHYVKIGNKLKDDSSIKELKEKIKQLQPTYESIREFLAYIMPSYCGKTQSIFAFGNDLLPFYFSVGISREKSQKIYKCFDGNYNALLDSYRLDIKEFSSSNFNSTGKEFLEFKNQKLHLLGLIKEMITVSRKYKSLPKKPCSWMEFQVQPRKINIKPISIREFHTLFPLDTITEEGRLSSKLLDLVIVLDEFPSIPSTGPFNFNQVVESVSLATFIRNLSRAVGISVMTMGTNSNTLNLVGVRSAGGESRDQLSTENLDNIWCVVFFGQSDLNLVGLINDSRSLKYFRINSDFPSFDFEKFGLFKPLKILISFIFKQIQTSRPGIALLLLNTLGDCLLAYETKKVSPVQKTFWLAFCTKASKAIHQEKRLFKEEAILGNIALMSSLDYSAMVSYEKMVLIHAHLYRFAPPLDSIELVDNVDSRFFSLYRPFSGSTLRYQLSDGEFSDWDPQVQPPNASDEFFIFTASWGYCSFLENDIYGAVSVPIAYIKLRANVGSILKSSHRSGTPKRDYLSFEQLCLSGVCNASHSGGFNKITSGLVFLKELTVHSTSTNIPPEQKKYLHEQFAIHIPTDCNFDSSLNIFEVPYLGPSNMLWGENIRGPLSGIMEFGNLYYPDDLEQVDILFDIKKNGVFIEKGGALEVKFHDKSLVFDDMVTYISGPKTRSCSLVIIACAVAPRPASTSEAYADLLSIARNEHINIYIVRHPKKPVNKTALIPVIGVKRKLSHENKLIPYKFEVDPIDALFIQPSRVLIILEGYFPISRK